MSGSVFGPRDCRPVVRAYRGQDREAVRQVCIATAAAPFQQRKELQPLLLTAFCDYYIEREPQNCFVAADAQDRAVGYILCAENADAWAKTFRAEYLANAPQEAVPFFEALLGTPLEFAQEYPAHLHIDILPEYQRMGLGALLMDALAAHLRRKGVPGLMLGVGADNEGARRFYQRYGFSVLQARPNETVMGLRLG